MKRTLSPLSGGLLTLLLSGYLSTPALAAGLQASDGAFQDYFGWSSVLRGNMGLVGAPWEDGTSSSEFAERGAAYLFRNLNTATGTITENIKMVASDAANRDELGTSVAFWGDIALVGAAYDNVSGISDRGTVYLYRNLSSASGAITETAKLAASDPTAEAYFGSSISMHGTSALVAASGANVGENDGQGAVYLYRDLHLVESGTTATETAKLISSDGDWYDWFGTSVALSGSLGVVSAYLTAAEGSAYLYRDLDAATGTITESAMFQNSNNAGFNGPIAMDGTSALLAAGPHAYLYRDLDTVDPLQETAILAFSQDTDYGAISIALSGSTALIGDSYQNRAEVDMGIAYLYTGLEGATGTRIEDIQITASQAGGNDRFGESVSLDGDGFIITAGGANGRVVYSGKAYYGTVSSMTTLDEGHASRDISAISFASRLDWTIGETTVYNTVTLGAGDRAELLDAEKAVYLGREAASDFNRLSIHGELVAETVHIGSENGSRGNILQFHEGSTFTLTTINLAFGNILSLEGDYTDIANLLVYLGETDLRVWDGSTWALLDSGNYASLLQSTFDSGYTSIAAIPEPSFYCLLAGAAGGMLLMRSRSRARL